MRTFFLTFLTAGIAVACTTSSPPPAPKPAPPGPEPVMTVVPPPADPGSASPSCTTSDDCDVGICEGKGCGEGEGTCAPASRACTDDLMRYCGCDGETFESSGSCPGRRFAHRGACKRDNPEGAAAGAACSEGHDCQSGICEGEGCGPGEGRCMEKGRMCTRDLVAYCGCDGVTFQSSGTCPGRRFEKRGPC